MNYTHKNNSVDEKLSRAMDWPQLSTSKNQFPDDKKIIGQQHQNGPKQGPKQNFLDPLFLLGK